MLKVTGIDQFEGPVGHAGIGGNIRPDVDVAQHIFFAGEIFLVHCQRQHDCYHLTGDASGRLGTGIHQNKSISVTGNDLDVGIGLLILNGDAAAGILIVFISRSAAGIRRKLRRHGDGGQHGNCHHCADQQGQYPFYRFLFHCAFSSPVW